MLLINLIQDNPQNKETLIKAKAPSEGESIFHCRWTIVFFFIGLSNDRV